MGIIGPTTRADREPNSRVVDIINDAASDPWDKAIKQDGIVSFVSDVAISANSQATFGVYGNDKNNPAYVHAISYAFKGQTGTDALVERFFTADPNGNPKHNTVSNPPEQSHQFDPPLRIPQDGSAQHRFINPTGSNVQLKITSVIQTQ